MSNLCAEDVAEAQLIVPVKRDIGRYIEELFPQAAADGKMFYLSEDIQDPWHAPVGVFADVAVQMERLLPAVLARAMSGPDGSDGKDCSKKVLLLLPRCARGDASVSADYVFSIPDLMSVVAPYLGVSCVFSFAMVNTHGMLLTDPASWAGNVVK
jgi:hypothetical protein